MNSSSGATLDDAATSGGLKEALKRNGREQVEGGKRFAADHIEDIADAIDAASVQLTRSQPNLAGYTTRVADGIAAVAKRLREGSIEDLAQDARQLAARNPAMFLLAGAAAGMVVARFLKASSAQDEPTPGVSYKDVSYVDTGR
jgi:hypothetical protein